MKKENGITLIALIITIIILLILAGVTINLTLGENGLFNTAKDAAGSYEEKAAEERLTTVLADLQAKKYVDPTYNDSTYINNEVTKSDMAIAGDIVLVDGYQFMIDRSVPKIDMPLGKGTENKDITIGGTSNPTADYTKSVIEITITYNGTLKEIIIDGVTITDYTHEDGVYTVTKEVNANGSYSIYVKDENDNYKIGNISVKEITEDMTIADEIEFQAFADAVNAGRTFEGKTVTLVDNINLSTVCSSTLGNWSKTIGSGAKPFKGTFDGNGYTISDLYINNGSNGQCLFGYSSGTIKNLTVSGTLSNTASTAGVVYFNYGIIENCISNCIISNSNKTWIVGVCQNNSGTVRKCTNLSNISSSATGNYWAFGGIVGTNAAGGIVEDCINKGDVSGNRMCSGIVVTNRGIVRRCVNNGNITIGASGQAGGIVCNNYNAGKIFNCYNTGSVSKAGTLGGIVGINGDNAKCYIYNCYSINKTNISGETKNSSEEKNCYTTGMTADKLNQGIDEVGETENTESPWMDDVLKEGSETEYKYNKGYPILKWQAE